MGFAQRKCLTFSPPYFFFFFFPPLEKDYLKREGFTETLAKFQAEANTVLGAVTLVSDMSPCAPLSCATAVLILLQKKLSLFFHQRMLHGIPQLQLYLLHCKCTTLPRVEPAATNTSPPPRINTNTLECLRDWGLQPESGVKPLRGILSEYAVFVEYVLPTSTRLL